MMFTITRNESRF